MAKIRVKYDGFSLYYYLIIVSFGKKSCDSSAKFHFKSHHEFRGFFVVCRVVGEGGLRYNLYEARAHPSIVSPI